MGSFTFSSEIYYITFSSIFPCFSGNRKVTKEKIKHVISVNAQ